MTDAASGFTFDARHATSPTPAATANRASFRPKIVLVGPTSVGKTSILLRQDGKGFTSHISSTMGASFCYINVPLDDGSKLEMQVWDTAGQERFRSMAPMYYRNAIGAIAVYDITSATSLTELKGWITELQRNIPSGLRLCLMGNKTDLESERRVSTDQGQQLATAVGAVAFVETSALRGTGINCGFKSLAQSLVDANNGSESQFSREAIFLQTSNETEQTDAVKEKKRTCSC